MVRCHVKGCLRSQNRDRSHSFFTLPKDPLRRKKWKEFAMIGDSLSGMRICSDHFELSSYKKRTPPKYLLNWQAIPTIRTPSIQNNEEISRPPLQNECVADDKKIILDVEKATETPPSLVEIPPVLAETPPSLAEILPALAEIQINGRINAIVTDHSSLSIQLPSGDIRLSVETSNNSNSCTLKNSTLVDSEEHSYSSSGSTDDGMMSKYDFRGVIKHFYLKKCTGVQIKAELDDVHGDSAPSLKTVYTWLNKFKEGQTSTQDAPRSGRPVLVTPSDILEKHHKVMEDRQVRGITEAVGISTERVNNIMHKKLEPKASDSQNASSEENRAPRKRKLRASDSDNEPKKLETLIKDEHIIEESHQEEIGTVLIKQEPGINEEICDDNIQTLFNHFDKVSDSQNATSEENRTPRKRKLRASESDTEPKKKETLIKDEHIIVQLHQEGIETLLIKQEPGISEELSDDDNTQTIFKQEPLSPLYSYSIKTEDADSELE